VAAGSRLGWSPSPPCLHLACLTAASPGSRSHCLLRTLQPQAGLFAFRQQLPPRCSSSRYAAPSTDDRWTPLRATTGLIRLVWTTQLGSYREQGLHASSSPIEHAVPHTRVRSQSQVLHLFTFKQFSRGNPHRQWGSCCTNIARSGCRRIRRIRRSKWQWISQPRRGQLRGLQ
jgi:hypothetical protein